MQCSTKQEKPALLKLGETLESILPANSSNQRLAIVINSRAGLSMEIIWHGQTTVSITVTLFGAYEATRT